MPAVLFRHLESDFFLDFLSKIRYREDLVYRYITINVPTTAVEVWALFQFIYSFSARRASSAGYSFIYYSISQITTIDCTLSLRAVYSVIASKKCSRLVFDARHLPLP